MDVIELHRRSVAEFVDRVAIGARRTVGRSDAVPRSGMSGSSSTTSSAENRWTAPLLAGATIAEVGDRVRRRPAGSRPRGGGRQAADEAVTTVAEVVPAGGKVHLSYGDEDMVEYVRQLAADHLIHAWDVAAATGGDTTLDPELVAEVGAWLADREELYRGAGLIGPRREGTFADARRRPARHVRAGPRLAAGPLDLLRT